MDRRLFLAGSGAAVAAALVPVVTFASESVRPWSKSDAFISQGWLQETYPIHALLVYDLLTSMENEQSFLISHDSYFLLDFRVPMDRVESVSLIESSIWRTDIGYINEVAPEVVVAMKDADVIRFKPAYVPHKDDHRFKWPHIDYEKGISQGYTEDMSRLTRMFNSYDKLVSHSV